MVTKKFKEAIEKLNLGQLQAVNAIEGPVMVIAGPGTGKTQVLILRIANILLKTQVNPENILALTFTDSGVYAMRKRLVEIIGTPGYRVEINTFHGFCNDLIKNNPDNFPNLISSESAGELEQIQIIEEIINRGKFTLLKPFGNSLHYVKPALRAIAELKKEGIAPEEFERAILEEEKDFEAIAGLYHEKGVHKGKMKTPYEKQLKNINKNKELFIIYKDYQNILRQKRLYDFNDMLLEVINAFEKDRQLLLGMQEQYQYVLIDEHQDTNTAQNRIVELLCGFYSNPNLFVVGDEKQSIYRFQGASLENFLYFKKLYPEALLVNLRENYRSGQIILDASGSLIKNNLLSGKFLSDNTKLVARSQHPPEKIKIISAKDYYSEYFWLADSIKKKIIQGTEPAEIAVLAKENKDLLPLADALEYNSIPYVFDSKTNLLQDIEIQKLILFFNTIYNFGKEGDFIKSMHIDCLEINPVDIVKLINLSREKKISVWEFVNSGLYKKDKSFKTAENIEKFCSNLTEWKILSHNEHFDVLFKNVVNNSGLMKNIITKKKSLQNLDKITSFYEAIKERINRKPDFNLEDFMDYLELLRKHNLPVKSSARAVYKNAVCLMTAHKSKGLEFDIVYVINVFDGHWGNSRKMGNGFAFPWEYLLKKITTLTKEEKNEDERRLFYVAITRARKEVIISYSTYSIEGRDQVQSQFIEEIIEMYKKILDIEEFERNFLKNKQIILSAPDPVAGKNIANEYLANRELFAEMFLKKGFAATHLNNYLKCPWRYFFRNLLGLPDVMNKSAMFGSSIHEALNIYLEHMTDKEPLSLEFLLDTYNKALLKQPLTTEEEEELKARGRKVLDGYYKQNMIYWGKNLTSELNIKGVQFFGKVKLTGKIDMIEPMENSFCDVAVYDFKTGKPKSRGIIEGTAESGNGDYKRQLIFYKILLDRYQYKKMKMVKGIVEFIEPNEKGIYKREVFDIKDYEVKELEQQIKGITDEILSFDFWDKGCKRADCEYCLLRSYLGS